MKAVGIKEFRDKATRYLAEKEAIAIKRHNKIIGFYVPVEVSEQEEIQTAIEKLENAIAQVTVEGALDEKALSEALNLSKSWDEWKLLPGLKQIPRRCKLAWGFQRLKT